jgi:hypothetical protein
MVWCRGDIHLNWAILWPLGLGEATKNFRMTPKNRRKWFDFARRKKRNTKGFVMEDSHADD